MLSHELARCRGRLRRASCPRGAQEYEYVLDFALDAPVGGCCLQGRTRIVLDFQEEARLFPSMNPVAPLRFSGERGAEARTTFLQARIAQLLLRDGDSQQQRFETLRPRSNASTSRGR